MEMLLRIAVFISYLAVAFDQGISQSTGVTPVQATNASNGTGRWTSDASNASTSLSPQPTNGASTTSRVTAAQTSAQFGSITTGSSSVVTSQRQSDVNCSCSSSNSLSAVLSGFTLLVALVVLAILVLLSVKLMKINRLLMGPASAISQKINANDKLSANESMAAAALSASIAGNANDRSPSGGYTSKAGENRMSNISMSSSGPTNQYNVSAGRSASKQNDYRLSSGSLGRTTDPTAGDSAFGKGNKHEMQTLARSNAIEQGAMYEVPDPKDYEYSYVDSLPRGRAVSDAVRLRHPKAPLPTPSSAVVYGERRFRISLRRSRSEPHPSFRPGARDYTPKPWRLLSRRKQKTPTKPAPYSQTPRKKDAPAPLATEKATNDASEDTYIDMQ